MPPKKTSSKKPRKGLNVPPVPPDIEGQVPSVSKPATKNRKKVPLVLPVTQAETTTAIQTTNGSNEPAQLSDTPRDVEQTSMVPLETLIPSKSPTKQCSKKKNEQAPNPDDVIQARNHLMQAISGTATSASNARPTPTLPPPLQTRRAAKAAAQAHADPVHEDLRPAVIEKPKMPQPRSRPPGLRLSPDSDDGFDIPKHRAKLARALERYHAENSPANVAPTRAAALTPLAPLEPSSTIPSLPNPTITSLATNQKAGLRVRTVEQVPVIAPATTQMVPKNRIPQAQVSSTITQTAAPTIRPVPQKPPSVVSPGGRHYSGLFPTATSSTLTGPGVLPPGAGRYVAHFGSRLPIPEAHGNDLLSGLLSDDDNSDGDENPDPVDQPTSSPPPIQYLSDPQEDRIICLCIKHGLDPKADYKKMARIYLAAKKKRQDEEEEDAQMSTDQEGEQEGSNEPKRCNGGDDGGRSGDHDGRGGDGGDEGGGSDDSGDDDDDDGDEGSSDDSDDDRYGPEHDAWLIDPNTNNELAPCTYHFQTHGCSMRYYGPLPEFVGSNGGFRVPRASVWQRADARREADRRRGENIAAGLIQPHNNDDEDSGSDYGTSQHELKSRGKPADSDLERESDVSSPIKSKDKGKGHEVPAIPLTSKGKGRVEPMVPFSSTKSDDKAKQWSTAAGSVAGAGGRPSIAELAACDALGVNFHRSVTDIGLLYGRRPEVVLARLGLAPAPTRHLSVWNAFQTLFALEGPQVPHDSDFISKCTKAYKQALDGLTPEQKQAFEHAIFEELDGIAEDPERVRTPAARMKTAIDEARKMLSIERYTPDLVRISLFIYTGPDPAARQLSCVVTPSNILKSTLERHNIALQPLIDIASDLIRGEATLQQVAGHHQGPATSEPADDIETIRRELHEFSSKEELAFYRMREEPKRALETAEKLTSKERAPMYRRICTTHILAEMNTFIPYGQQKRKTVPFGNWAAVATSWQITLLSWPDEVTIWPGCPRNMKHLIGSDWQKLCTPFIDNPANAVRIEAWTDKQKGYPPDSQEYRLIPLVKNVSGDVLVNVFEGQALIRRPRVRGTGTRNTTAVPRVGDDNSNQDDGEPVQADLNMHGIAGIGDDIEDLDDEDFAEDIDDIVSTDDDNADLGMVEHNGNVLYRIRSVTPDAVPHIPKKRGVRPAEEYDEDYMYKLDRLEREQQRQGARDICPLPQHCAPNPSPVQVRQRHTETKLRPETSALKRRRQDDDSTEHRHNKRKIVRIQPPPDEERVQDRHEEVARLQQLRNMPVQAPCRPHIPPLVFPPPSQLPAAGRPGGASTAAFYKAMGGPPPSSRPLVPPPRSHHSTIPQSTQQVAADSRRPAKPRIPARFDSDGADDLSSGPNCLLPSVRFDRQREVRDGQAGPSNERFIPKGQGKSRRHDG